MKDFRLFDISDFVMDEDFIRWVNERKKADNDFWDSWLNQHPDKYMAVTEARRILESIGTEHRVISEVEKQGEINRLMRTIRNQSQQAEPEARVVTISRKWWYAAATLLLAVASTAVYFLAKKDDGTGSERFSYTAITPSKHLIENINTSGKAITLKLPDGSTVELGANSRISYANNFDSIGTRDVYLSGVAFFTVTKNPARPFRVFANEIVTKVLGTSFIVRSFEKDTTIQVTVRTGKVSVYSQATANAKETSSPNQLGGIILTPNQKLVYEKAKQKFQKGLLENPVAVLPEAINQVNVMYEDVSLEKVFSQLSKIYGISIVYDNELLKKCTVTADLRNETFYNKLELICKAVGARYEVMDGQVIIQTNGCD
jgi:ferric-dicitrate binding protein FerR (iron transport regulator)